jgi:3-hydroxymyristoyl/3-hydroxydecanoyl-(acyl carrier protein) dehydratase
MNEDLSYEKIINELSGTGKGMISHTECKKYLRHDHPVLGVDWIKDHDFERGWVHAVRGISISDPVFAGHFADAAMYPGTNLTQDINQIATLLFTAMTGPMDGEVTAFKNINSDYGHPIPPGCVIDFAVWASDSGDNKTMQMSLVGKIRDFPYYDTPNKYGLTFKPAITASSIIVRAKRKIYDGIWM